MSRQSLESKCVIILIVIRVLKSYTIISNKTAVHATSQRTHCSVRIIKLIRSYLNFLLATKVQCTSSPTHAVLCSSVHGCISL